MFYEVQSQGAGFWAAMLSAVAAGTVLGALMQLVIMRPLRGSAAITRVIATLGVFIALHAAAALHYKDTLLYVDPYLPQASWRVAGVPIVADRLELLALAVVLTGLLALAKRRSLLGLATSAMAQNERAAATLGWSPDLLATLNWCIGGALAGLAGALIARLTGLLVTSMALLVVPALAAALLGRFDSFGWTLVGAVGIGVIQALSLHYVHLNGVSDGIPFLVIIVVLVVTGRALPLRGHVGERLPSIGTGRLRPVVVTCVSVPIGVLILSVFSPTWSDAFAVSMAVSIVLLSLVVVTGYAGQISLAQFALAGFGARAGRLVAADHWPFRAANVGGVAAAVPVGMVFGLPTLRTRGVSLAVVTLGLAVAAQRMVFESGDFTGGTAGTTVGATHLFGIDMSPTGHPGRYALVVLVALVLSIVAIANLRRSRAGRRLIAIRANERAAASLGIAVVGGKLYAFTLASTIAALGGILLAFRNSTIVFDSFGAVPSLNALGFTVIGGLGYLMGPVVGSTLASGGVATLTNPLFHGIENYLALISGCVVVLMVVLNPGGVVPAWVGKSRRIARKMRPLRARMRLVHAVSPASAGCVRTPRRMRWPKRLCRGSSSSPATCACRT